MGMGIFQANVLGRGAPVVDGVALDRRGYTSLKRVNETIFTPVPRKEPWCGHRPILPFPRARWSLCEPGTAYPREGYFTTGYPLADQYLLAPTRYGLPEALGALGLDTTLSPVGAPRTGLGMAATAAVVLALAYGAWELGKFALKG